MKAPTRQICVADSNPSRTARTPEATVEEFYKWYAHMLRENRDPITQEENALQQYVASALIEKIQKQINSPEGLESDYFTKAQDYFDDWETDVSATEAKISNDKASTTVTLGANDKSKYKLYVILTKEGDAWKIMRVNRPIVVKKLHPK